MKVTVSGINGFPDEILPDAILTITVACRQDGEDGPYTSTIFNPNCTEDRKGQAVMFMFKALMENAGWYAVLEQFSMARALYRADRGEV